MAEHPTRRAYLHEALQTAGHPVTTETAVQLLDGSPYAAGRTTYHLISTTQGDR